MSSQMYDENSLDDQVVHDRVIKSPSTALPASLASLMFCVLDCVAGFPSAIFTSFMSKTSTSLKCKKSEFVNSIRTLWTLLNDD